MENRIKLMEKSEASAQSQEMLSQIEQKFGKIPNVFKMMANSPAVLKSYLCFSGALSEGKLCPQIQERIALYIAQLNGCEYCLAAHSMIAQGAVLSSDEILMARQGMSSDRKANAALGFVLEMFETRGQIDTEILDEIREAGFCDEEIMEMTAAISLNILTNSLNSLAQTEVDFPKVKECGSCSCC